MCSQQSQTNLTLVEKPDNRRVNPILLTHTGLFISHKQSAAFKICFSKCKFISDGQFSPREVTCGVTFWPKSRSLFGLFP